MDLEFIDIQTVTFTKETGQMTNKMVFKLK